MNKLFALALFSFAFTSIQAQKKQEPTKGYDNSAVGDLKFRLVGPALTSGRISDIKVHPDNNNIWFVTAASGGVWKTTNHGTTFEPIFDSYGSYSIACVTLAPSNPNTVWIGTGENNNQRSVAYGDGVYKSLDGGKSFKNMGLKNSEHIGNIIIDPKNENTIWVAAYGPVWSKGGERGVYKSIDGGKTWKQTLTISENTGVAEIAIDPTNSNILYASAHQRRRREWTYIGGGPESGLYKSTDGGETWKEINEGLPKEQMGRIGIAVSPVNSNYVYAIVEARDDKGGFFRSTNMGESWSKMSNHSTSGNYYQEIICDLTNQDKVFSMDTWLHHTEDGGKTFKATGEDKKHVDNHCIWIDPKDANHWIVGCDGGLYETYNHAADWKYYDNLPIIQFYKVATDNAEPFYNIYGGTQDNNSMGGPSNSINNAGILNSDWFITNGGDGFESAIDPLDPNTAYAQAQYGWLIRYDKRTGEKTPIQPMPGKGEEGYRWNWDAPLLISPHNNKTLYFCANKVFKSTNQGDDWETISPDLTQQIDRNKLPVMDQVWSIDAVMKNKSTTIYGNIVAFDESPLKEGLLYTGTDDGLIQISNDGGTTWTKSGTLSGVPGNTRINMLTASNHDENVVFAVLNNHRSGDFKPYIFKSTDKGKTWKSISSNLPERGSAYAIKQDYVNKDLLVAGTEFGCYFSNDAGTSWTKLNGLPTIAVYDIELHKRESDIVVATFGRGFYVLDDYSPLRTLNTQLLNEEAVLYPIKDAKLYIPSSPLGLTGTGSQGADLWAASNSEFGATFSLYLKDVKGSLKDERQKQQSELEKKKSPVDYPSFESLREEANEDKTQLMWLIKNDSGVEIKRILSSPKKGLQRISWDLRSESTSPIQLSKSTPGRYSSPDNGFMVNPGKYSVEVKLIKDGVISNLIEKTDFVVVGLNNQTNKNESIELVEFRTKVAELKRKMDGTSRLISEMNEKLSFYEHAILNYPKTDLALLKNTESIKITMNELQVRFWGDGLKASHEFETAPSISDRFGMVYYQLFSNTSKVTSTQKTNYTISLEDYSKFREDFDSVIKQIKTIEDKLDASGIPYIKGKDENWKQN